MAQRKQSKLQGSRFKSRITARYLLVLAIVAAGILIALAVYFVSNKVKSEGNLAYSATTSFIPVQKEDSVYVTLTSSNQPDIVVSTGEDSTSPRISVDKQIKVHNHKIEFTVTAVYSDAVGDTLTSTVTRIHLKNKLAAGTYEVVVHLAKDIGLSIGPPRATTLKTSFSVK